MHPLANISVKFKFWFLNFSNYSMWNRSCRWLVESLHSVRCVRLQPTRSEKPRPLTLGEQDFGNICASIKVALLVSAKLRGFYHRFAGVPADWLFRPRLRRGLCQRKSVRYRPWCAYCQSDQRHLTEPHPRIVHVRRPEVGWETATPDPRRAGFCQHLCRHQGWLHLFDC